MGVPSYLVIKWSQHFLFSDANQPSWSLMWRKTPQVVLVSKGERHFQRQWGVPDNQGWNVNLWDPPGPWFHWKDATLLDPYDEDYEEKLKVRLHVRLKSVWHMGCLKRLSIFSFHLFKLGLCWISFAVGKWMKTWWKRKTSFFLTWNGHFIQIFQRQGKEEKEAEAKKESQGKKKKKALWHSNQYQLCVSLWVGKNLLFQHENFRICSILQEVVQENAEMPPVPPSTVAGRQ